MLPDMYRLLTFELPQNLHLGISKRPKETLIVYVSAGTILINLAYIKDQWKPLIQVQRAVHLVCNAYPRAIEKNFGGTRLWVKFSRGYIQTV